MGRLGSSPAFLFLALAALLAAAGCSDNTCRPRICGPAPTLENIWPNEDQMFWEYEYTIRTWAGSLFDTLYDAKEDVPPAPTFEYVEALLDNHPIGDNVDTRQGFYRLIFDGDSSNAYGVTAQALKESLYVEGKPVMDGGRPSLRDIVLGRAGAEVTSLPPGSMWSELKAGYGSMQEEIDPGPYLVHGGIWEKNEAWIGTYCLIDTNLCWKFLEENLTPGHQFTHQLIPGLTFDAFLHCKVLRMGDFRLNGEVYPNALECVYILDYGAHQFIATGGVSIGWIRNYDYGMVVYAPTVGPVYSYERALVEAGNDDSRGLGDKTLVLETAGADPQGECPKR